MSRNSQYQRSPMVLHRIHRFFWRSHPRLLAAMVGSLVLMTGTRVSFAGDMLRGGAAPNTLPPGATPVSSNFNGISAAHSAAKQNANDHLAQTAQVMEGLRAAQSAARAAAKASAIQNLGVNPNNPLINLPDVPNGLVQGGLVPDSGLVTPGVANPVSSTTWVNAKTPVQTVDANGTTVVTVDQDGKLAYTQWDKFNIGSSTRLHFQQDATDWAAFNFVKDPSMEPSQILGTMDAIGAIHVINPNGIIFGGGSQINARALVASTLPFNENFLNRSMLDNPDHQFQYSSIKVEKVDPIAEPTLPTFDPENASRTTLFLTAGDGTKYSGDITVQEGAVISTPHQLVEGEVNNASAGDSTESLVALIAPNVNNKGTIQAEGGQVILAAGQQVELEARDSSKTDIRGMDVYVGKVDKGGAPTGGTVIHDGIIETSKGNVTLVGREVKLNGAIANTTSATFNGSVSLLANFDSKQLKNALQYTMTPSQTGLVDMGDNSVMQILPEWESDEEVFELLQRSIFQVQGQAIHMGQDSLIFAPNAVGKLQAGSWVNLNPGIPDNPLTFSSTLGQIYLDQGSIIDVSGSMDYLASLSKFIVPVELRGPELADFPLQRQSILKGKTVVVDMRVSGEFNGTEWVGSPIANLEGYKNNILSRVGELTVDGGTIELTAGQSVVMQPGSLINVAGGSINYEGAVVNTTKVVSGGVVFDISKATPDQIYTGVFTPTINQLESDGAHFEQGYVQGGNGGSILITAPSVALDGNLMGGEIAGPYQRNQLPTPSLLSIFFKAQDPNSPSTDPFRDFSPTPPTVVLTSAKSTSAVAAFDPLYDRTIQADGTIADLKLAAGHEALVELSPGLMNANGLGQLVIRNPDGNISLPVESSLTGSPGGKVSLVGANVDIQGSIRIPGGSIELEAHNQKLGTIRLGVTPPALSGRGTVTLGSTANLDTTGLIVDDRITSPSAFTQSFYTSGGDISIKGLSVVLNSGSQFDVSGGVAIDQNNKVAFGNAGSILIRAGFDPTSGFEDVIGGSLTFHSTLRGYSGAQGGTLGVTAPMIQVEGVAPDARTLLLEGSFFSQGGFSTFDLTGLGIQKTAGVFLPGIHVVGDVSPIVQGYQLTPGGAASLLVTTLDEGIRSTASLNLDATGVRTKEGSLVIRGDLLIDPGASITTDARGEVSLSGHTVAVLGNVRAPSGSITINSHADRDSIASDILLSGSGFVPTVDLGPSSVLSVAGSTLLTPNQFGFRTGTVLDGGTIHVAGNVFAESGSILDVSGTADTLDLTPGEVGFTVAPAVNLSPSLLKPSSQLVRIPTSVASGGGKIEMTGKNLLIMDSTLKGNAGGSSAQGGQLVLSSGPALIANNANPSTVTFNLMQSAAGMPTVTYSAGENAIGKTVLLSGNPIQGPGFFAADRLVGSGFDYLDLRGNVQYSGNVNLSLGSEIKLASSGILLASALTPNATLTLQAPHVRIGTELQNPETALDKILNPLSILKNGSSEFFIQPTSGSGKVDVSSRLIEVGNLSLQNIGNLGLTATAGEIRGSGNLNLAGTLEMTAAQIYPLTDTFFNIAVYDPDGSSPLEGNINIQSSPGNLSLPFSAGGSLNLYAQNINQGGVLRAPNGVIQLGLDSQATPIQSKDLLSGLTFPSANKVILSGGSVTSVSLMDPLTGQPGLLPYGTVLNGIQWLNPAGEDISAFPIPSKRVNANASLVEVVDGAVVDLQGGGNLYAHEFIPGLGGSTDILDAADSFAVVPGFNGLGGDLDFHGSELGVGDQIQLGSGSGLPAGTYTLLPARYALLPGAYLVRKSSGTPIGQALHQLDGSVLVSGYRLNGLNLSQTGQPVLSLYEVASPEVIQQRAQYDVYTANEWLREDALGKGVIVPRSPVDAGQFVMSASTELKFAGSVLANKPIEGAGALVDIASAKNIRIIDQITGSDPTSLLILADDLNRIGAESLLVGGVRKEGSKGFTVNVLTPELTLDNAGDALVGQDLILASKSKLTLEPGSIIEQTQALTSPAQTLLLSGEGALVRVSGNASAPVIRTDVPSVSSALLTVGAGSRLTGDRVQLDSTGLILFDGSSAIESGAVDLSSGQISLELDHAGGGASGLVLSKTVLDDLLFNTRQLSLLSYSSIDIFGDGEIGGFDPSTGYSIGSLALHAGNIRGFDNGLGPVTIQAEKILLDNLGNVTGSSVGATTAGSTLVLNADRILLGVNQLGLDQYEQVNMNPTEGLFLQGSGGVNFDGHATITTPGITGVEGLAGLNQSLVADGNLILNPLSGSTLVASGLGMDLKIQGASIVQGTDLLLPSGSITLQATGAGGDVNVTGKMDVGGIQRNYYDVAQYTDGGRITLISDQGNVVTDAGSILNVAASSGGGKGGTIGINAVTGNLTFGGTWEGAGGSAGLAGGRFTFDADQLADVSGLNDLLNLGGFNTSRSFRVRSGDVVLNGLATVQSFDLSVDQGQLDVSGTVDAHGTTGGSISLHAGRSLNLMSGSLLDVSAAQLDHAGKGGSIFLETRGNSGGVLDLQTGSTLDLRVNSGAGGTLHLRAPQTAGPDVAMNPINATVNGASKISVEGFKVYTPAGGTINATLENQIKTDGTALGNQTTTVLNRLLANNAGLASVTHLNPGAEIVNATGDLTLASDWNLSGFRFGPGVTATAGSGEAGFLTLRAQGDLVFQGALSDGFDATTGFTRLYQQPLLPDGSSSWSYRLVAGADTSSANSSAVLPIASLTASKGSLLLGKDAASDPVLGGLSSTSLLESALQNGKFYQVIRTGTGDIDIAAARNVFLLNPFATIYTAGMLSADQDLGGTFDVPVTDKWSSSKSLATGLVGFEIRTGNSLYPAQYTEGGGNISIFAGHDIAHMADFGGQLVLDSEFQLPTNWLFRRNNLASDGSYELGRTLVNNTPSAEEMSPSWWVSYMSFYEGIGALGGGNVSLVAGHDIANVDGLIPTNARMPRNQHDALSLVEQGGGDLLVQAGNNINGGVYYVEKGTGTLIAGNEVTTNNRRAPALTARLGELGVESAPEGFLPTTLFVGKSQFDVSARNDLLLGPSANLFLLPEGISNQVWYKTAFSTYSSDASVSADSLAGDIILRQRGNQANSANPTSLLFTYLSMMVNLPNTIAQKQPWIRLNETGNNDTSGSEEVGSQFADYEFPASVMAPTLKLTAFSGDVNVVGNLYLAPSPEGTVDLIANGSINGLNITGFNTTTLRDVWSSGQIFVSDANPSSVPSVLSPIDVIGEVPVPKNSFETSGANYDKLLKLTIINQIFGDTGSTSDSAQLNQLRHGLISDPLDPSSLIPLHQRDAEPIHLYSLNGDIADLKLFAPKSVRTAAGRDLSDIAFFIQNINPDDFSLISANRDILAFNPNSARRVEGSSGANEIFGSPFSGEIQIGGPGTLELLAGRNFDLGVGGDGLGVTSIGDIRNPNLGKKGSDIIVGAGLLGFSGGPSLGDSHMDFAGFQQLFLDPATAGENAAAYLPYIGEQLKVTQGEILTPAEQLLAWNEFLLQSPENQEKLMLDVFYLTLRDAGRQHVTLGSEYDLAYQSIEALFPMNQSWEGDIKLVSRQIATKSGGSISLIAPGGAVEVGSNIDAGGKAADQGILTERGGDISLFARDSVNVGKSRIFTLLGGNEIIWSSLGDVAAGFSAKTVSAAPPTRVIVDPQTGLLRLDIAGLATGGGIGVLTSVPGTPPSDIDLIAPVGAVDPGDAGVRSSGNLSIAADRILNADNIRAGGTTAGVATPTAAPEVSAPTTSVASANKNSDGAGDASLNNRPADIITVEVLGYGDESSPSKDDDEEKKKKKVARSKSEESVGVKEVSQL